MSKTCDQCGELFEPSKFHPKQRFCPGGKCRAKWEAVNQYNPKSYICKHCGEVFFPKRPDRNQYCGRKCSSAAKAVKHRGILPVFVFVCPKCGERTKHGKNCEKCQRLNNLAWLYIRDLCRKLDKGVVYICKECSKEFTSEYGNKRRAFCSDECSSRYHSRVDKATRRARKRGAKRRDAIDPIAVFERDGWKCHLCKQKTSKHLRGTIEDNAPEMDHIIPLAAGGSHTWDNVACACRKCNGIKGSQIIGQQLLPVFAGI